MEPGEIQLLQLLKFLLHLKATVNDNDFDKNNDSEQSSVDYVRV